mgnify:CR=1 FL=1
MELKQRNETQNREFSMNFESIYVESDQKLFSSLQKVFELLNNLSRPARCRVTCRKDLLCFLSKSYEKSEKKSGSHKNEINLIEFPLTYAHKA